MKAKIRHTQGNVLTLIDIYQKHRHKLTPEIEIIIQRGFDFNRRIDFPSMGVCISADNIPLQAPVLFHHNATDMGYEVLDHGFTLDKGVKLFSLPENLVYMYRDNTNTWIPCKDFVISLRLFRKGSSVLIQQEPVQYIPNRLYIVRGIHEGSVVVVTPFSDYEINYTENGVPGKIIRTREREIMAIDEALTTELKEQKVYMGIDPQELYIWQKR